MGCCLTSAQPPVIGSAVSLRSEQSNGSSHFWACCCLGCSPGRLRLSSRVLEGQSPTFGSLAGCVLHSPWDHCLSCPFDHSWRLSRLGLDDPHRVAATGQTSWTDTFPESFWRADASFQGRNQRCVRVLCCVVSGAYGGCQPRKAWVAGTPETPRSWVHGWGECHHVPL